MQDDPAAYAPHPLAIMLGTSWRWFNASDQTTLLLHATGLHSTVSLEFLATATDAACLATAEALDAVLLRGMTGEVVIELTRAADGTCTAVARPTARLMHATVDRNTRARATYPVLDRDAGSETFADVERGKYTFRVRDGEVYIDRYREPWARADNAGKALIAIVHELHDARDRIDELARTLGVAAQPAPAGTEGDVWAELIAICEVNAPRWDALLPFMRIRREQGIARYKTPLRRGDGRVHAHDEGQEHLDAAVYRFARSGATDLYAVERFLCDAAECFDIRIVRAL